MQSSFPLLWNESSLNVTKLHFAWELTHTAAAFFQRSLLHTQNKPPSREEQIKGPNNQK